MTIATGFASTHRLGRPAIAELVRDHAAVAAPCFGPRAERRGNPDALRRGFCRSAAPCAVRVVRNASRLGGRRVYHAGGGGTVVTRSCLSVPFFPGALVQFVGRGISCQVSAASIAQNQPIADVHCARSRWRYCRGVPEPHRARPSGSCDTAESRWRPDRRTRRSPSGAVRSGHLLRRRVHVHIVAADLPCRVSRLQSRRADFRGPARVVSTTLQRIAAAFAPAILSCSADRRRLPKPLRGHVLDPRGRRAYRKRPTAGSLSAFELDLRGPTRRRAASGRSFWPGLAGFPRLGIADGERSCRPRDPGSAKARAHV